MTRFFSSLRVRLLIVVLLSALPALGLILYSGMEQRRLTAEEAKINALRLTRLAANNQEALIEGAHQLLLALSQLPQIRQPDLNSCGSFLASLQKQYPNYTALNLVQPDGTIICNSVPNSQEINIADHDYFQHALQTKGFVIGNFSLGPSTHKMVLPFTYPVFSVDGQVESVLLVTLDLNWLNQLVPQVELPPNSTLLVVDNNGTVLFRYPNPDLWVGKSLSDVPVIQAIVNTQGDGTAETAGLDGINRLYAFTSLRTGTDNNVHLGIGIPTQVAFLETNRVLARNLIGLGWVTALSLGAAWYVGDVFILNQVKALLVATRRLAAGDLSARSGVPSGEGEINELAASFDQMAQTLQQRQDQLHQAEAKYRTLIEQIPAIIYTLELGPVYGALYVSPQIESLLGYSPEEWTSHPSLWSGRLHPDDRERVIRERTASGADGTPFRAEYRVLSKDNTQLWVRDEAMLVRDEKDQPVMMQGIMVDITERKQAEAVLALYAVQLERSNRELQDFAYIASHDLQEPLRKIQAFGERLEVKFGEALAPDGMDYLRRMLSSAVRMQSLINDLLAYSRVTTKAQPFESVDLSQVISEVIADLEERIKETGGKVETETLPTITGDPVQMQQLFQNLIANALKFHQPETPPQVKVYANIMHAPNSPGSKIVQICVEDNGIGFDEKYLDRIFQPFQRLNSREEYQGSGIGLAICRKIVLRHNGDLTASSTPGKGSTFIITLPVKQPRKTN